MYNSNLSKFRHPSIVWMAAIFLDIFFSKKYLAQLYFMSLIHMKYFLIKYVCLTTIMTTLVSLNCNCVKSVTVELNVKAKYYLMLCVSKAV